ncbi:MAG: hypothetical protein FWG37_05605 [Clostridia bacterium]|nr:hypothetical protein [Clostridia bacterium]
MCKMLADKKPVKRINVAGRDDIFAYEFFDGTANLLSNATVLWTTSETPITIHSEVPILLDPFGNDAKRADNNIIITRQPVYVLGNAFLENAKIIDTPDAPDIKPKTVLLDDFADVKWEQNGGWKLGWLGSGHEGTTLRSVPEFEGKKCARLDYAADPAKGKYGLCYMQIDKMIPLPENASTIGVWIYGDNSDYPLGIRLLDRYGETFQFNIAPKIDWTGWRYCQADIKNDRFHAFGGDENKRLDPPFSFIAFDMSVTPPGATSGTIYFADLEFRQ